VIVIAPLCEVEAVNVVSPRYVATMVLTPMGSFVEVKFANPVGSTAAVPSVLEPSTKLTAPVGIVGDEPVDTICAVSLTGRPCNAVAAETVSIVVVNTRGCDTVTLTFVEVEGEYVGEPVKLALNTCVPTVTDALDHVAWPALFSDEVDSVFVPS
jgi:hypothetical protein